MIKNLSPPRLDDVRRWFSYDAETGDLMWKEKRSNRVKVGAEVGCQRPDGYRVVWFDGSLYRVHRMIWFLVTGEWPEVVDHINGDRADNRIVNLRASSKLLNAWNSRHHRDGTCKFKGVTKSEGRFEAQICADGRKIYLGRYATEAEAHAVYCEASARYHGEHGRTE